MILNEKLIRMMAGRAQKSVKVISLATILMFSAGVNAKPYDESICLKKNKDYWVQFSTNEDKKNYANTNHTYNVRTNLNGSWKAKSTIKKGYNKVQTFNHFIYLRNLSTGKKSSYKLDGPLWANSDGPKMGGCNPLQNVFGGLDCLEHDLCLKAESVNHNGLAVDKSCGVEFGHALTDYIMSAFCAAHWL